MKIKPGPTAEAIVCQRCEGCRWLDGGETCPRCDENGLTTEYDCGCCGDTYDLRREKYFTAQGVGLTPALVTYSVGPRTYHYCEHCAQAEAIGDGEGLRAMLRDLGRLKDASKGTCNDIDAYLSGIIIGHAASLEQVVLDLCEQCGVEAK